MEIPVLTILRAYHRKSAAVLKTVLSLAILAAPVRVFGQGFSRVSVPIAVEIEGRRVHCPLYLNLEMKSYNVPFDKFAAGPRDNAEAMFATAVQAISKEDAAKFESVWTSPDQMKSLGKVTVVKEDNSAESWIKLARSNFDFDHITVVAELHVGPETMFLWNSTTKAGTQLSAFYIGHDRKNQLRLSAVSSEAPVEALILNGFEARTGADAAKPLPNINLRYQYPIPLAGKGDPGAHPVFFEFDGSPMDFPISDEKVKPPTPLLEFLRNATLALQNGKNDEFANDFTPRSREEVRQWLTATESRKRSRRQSQRGASPVSNPETGLTLVMAANVKFVLNADPVFLVFQARPAGNNWAPGNLTYSYVLRDGRTYRLTNLFSLNTLDDFLQVPALFDNNFLKPAPTKPRTPNH